MTDVQATRRWRGVIGLSLFAGAIGLLAQRPSLLLLATVGVAFAAYPRVLSTPTVTLDLERSLSPPTPDHGEPVEVTVSIRNEGEELLPDLRIVDGVPPMLSVTDDSDRPRHATALRPGETTTFTYEVTAKHGIHWFDPVTVVARDLSGGTEVETTVAEETEIECSAAGSGAPPLRQTQQFVGPITTDEGGTGIEFYGTRQYRPGDSVNRIDWRRFARTGDLTTVEYREERLATIVLCVDAREPAYRATSPEDPHAVSYAMGAADDLLGALLETPNKVGLAAIGREFCWLPPGNSAEHGQRARELIGTHETLSAHPPSPETAAVDGQLLELRKRLPADAQVVFISPLTDDVIPEAAVEFESTGHSIVVVSPDVSTDATIGAELATIERNHRLMSLRKQDIPAVDWEPTDALGAAMLQTRERWSA